ncbi:MAG TPA: hypothetical protein VNN22_21660 [Verrucomicrobiae bacterium]|nr:hypothetical protein [Verrucomicrobiae bacterium]
MNLIARTFGCLGLLLFSIGVNFPCRAEDQKWVVHEWGTFTSLQDEAGEAIGGINTDDEPVPDFVHELGSFILLRPTEVPNNFFQGAPSCHPDVTMRLETPVLYFHPPKGETHTHSANVSVKFRGGWLTEYYPDAVADALEFKDSRFQPGLTRLSRFGPLRSSTESKLTWSDLKIGDDWNLTNTTAHVWTSPRAVSASSVQTTNGESEKFLFYRGVAHIDAPLKISRDANSGELLFRSQLENLPVNKPLIISSLWLVDIQPDGKIAFRPLPSLQLGPDPGEILTHTPAVFSPGDFSSGNLEKLKASLQAALVADGLFADEAQALLNTWELSYFKSAGLRVFFLVPCEWTDFYLPLEISPPAEINRVMVGRIELVTPELRSRLQKISSLSKPQIELEARQMFTNYYGKITFNSMFGATNRPGRSEMQQINQDLAQMNAGQKTLASFIPVPDGYQTYLDLGRFRNALILEDARRHTSLTNFIALYQLDAYQPTLAALK